MKFLAYSPNYFYFFLVLENFLITKELDQM